MEHLWVSTYVWLIMHATWMSCTIWHWWILHTSKRQSPGSKRSIMWEKCGTSCQASTFAWKYLFHLQMPLFVFLSDNIKWVEENFSRSPKLCSQSECTFFGTRRHGVTKDTTFHHGGSEETGKDLATLAACNHTIYTYGTFGMWGALLAGSSPNHEVVIPAGYHTLTRHRIAKANLVGWKVLD